MSRGQRPQRKRRRRRSLIYLRVSDRKQVNTDYDPEGISLPAQRRKCRRKADDIDAIVVDEYIEPGRSATTVDKRPEFQKMLARIKQDRDIDCVIVYALSRANRNRFDDAVMMMMMRKLGVSLVSATENIDDTPAGQLLHGVLATVNEFRSRSDGEDVRYKMGEKARNGGTPFRAPVGYLNIREQFEGRTIATVALDPERAPLVRTAFDMYATGKHTLESLEERMADLGLRALPHGQQPVKLISRSQLGRMLRDRYYIGKVCFQGQEHPGRHKPLITADVFDQVQRVLDSQSGSGTRHRRHDHYLKGALRCHRCGHRLILTHATGSSGGVYPYFFCRGRQEHVCDLPYLPVDTVEKAVADHYATITFDQGFREAVRVAVDQALVADSDTTADLRRKLTARLTALDTQEDGYLDLVGDPDWPQDKLTAKIRDIKTQRERVQTEIDKLTEDHTTGRNVIMAALSVLDNPRKLYRTADDPLRKKINTLIFVSLAIDWHDDAATVAGHQLAEPFDTLIPAAQTTANQAAAQRGTRDSTARARHGHSSSKAIWVPPARLVQHLHEAGPAVSCWFRRLSRLFGVAVARAVMCCERQEDHHGAVDVASRRLGLRAVRC